MNNPYLLVVNSNGELQLYDIHNFVTRSYGLCNIKEIKQIIVNIKTNNIVGVPCVVTFKVGNNEHHRSVIYQIECNLTIKRREFASCRIVPKYAIRYYILRKYINEAWETTIHFYNLYSTKEMFCTRLDGYLKNHWLIADDKILILVNEKYSSPEERKRINKLETGDQFIVCKIIKKKLITCETKYIERSFKYMPRIMRYNDKYCLFNYTNSNINKILNTETYKIDNYTEKYDDYFNSKFIEQFTKLRGINYKCAVIIPQDSEFIELYKKKLFEILKLNYMSKDLILLIWKYYLIVTHTVYL